MTEIIFFVETSQIELIEGTPRLFLTRSANLPAANDCLNKNDSELGSFHEFFEDVKQYDHYSSGDEAASISNHLEPVDGEVNSALSIILDGEDEKEILRCFEICNKASRNRQQQRLDEANRSMKEVTLKVPPSLGESTPSRRVEQLIHREIQTSVTYVVQESPDIAVHHTTQQSVYSSKNFPSSTRDLNNSMNNYCYEEDCNGSITSSTDVPSAYEIFDNQGFADDSDTAHFTSLTVSRAGPSPPDTPPKKGVPSIGHRVKFSSFYDLDHRIPAQMEPLTMFDVESSDSSEEVASDRARKLPRFPVQCPISNCESNSVPSDFCNHVTIDHPYIDVMKAAPGKIINIEINSKTNPNMISCQRLFLVTDRIT